MNMSTAATNDVWATLNKGIEAIADYKTAKLQSDVFRTAAPNHATAAPSGAPGYTVFNPLPWAWGGSSNPQADSKPQPSQGISMGGGSMWLILGAVLVLVLALARR
jgi:hypothetical protein